MSLGNKCFNCGKGIMIGHNVSHAKNRTRKIFKPNLHKTRIVVKGTPMRVKLCTKCKRQIKTSTSAKASADKQNSKVKNKSQNLKSSELKSSEVSSSTPAVTGTV